MKNNKPSKLLEKLQNCPHGNQSLSEQDRYVICFDCGSVRRVASWQWSVEKGVHLEFLAAPGPWVAPSFWRSNV